ncbi:hypothetical protein [Pedobacter xixiisoli]|uniref:Uncharacterized protein n=1 Tax=Pedobacter xixiisoli TaxID=1476464 RepID=A0A285ZS59_9SPHI|nr:hypothetical protein [Pedobacter xixiisoli]SOD12479.1 hypothetical protein SAMN06297358_0690 [Pedobacter xixiisoli]
MKTKFLTLAVLGLAITAAKAQTYGTWKGSKEATSWTYDLNTGTGSGKKFNSGSEVKTSESSKEKPGFLPYPAVGTARIVVAPSSGSGFSLNKSVINFGASNGEAPTKFSVTDIPQSAPVGSLFFTLSFNDGVKGTAVLAFGNSQTSIFKNAAAYNNRKQEGLFGAIRFIVGSTFTNPEHRTASGSSYVHKAYDADIFDKSGNLNIEIYSNNSKEEQSFTRKGNIYTLPAQTFKIFVGDKTLKFNGSENLPATGELDPNMAIDAFMLSGASSAENTLSFSISNIKAGTLAAN